MLFILLQREREQEQKNGRQRENEREKHAPRWAGSPMRGLIPGLWDHDLSWRQTFKHWATHAPLPFEDFISYVLILKCFIQQMIDLFINSVKYSRHYAKPWYYSNKYDDSFCVSAWLTLGYSDLRLNIVF